MPPETGQSSQVKSATRTLDIIEYAVAHDRPLVAQEIATALNIPVSSLSYLLSTLVERSYLVRDGRRYSPGPGLERLRRRGGGPSLAERAGALVKRLSLQLNETASFFVRSGWEMEAIVTETAQQALRYSLQTGVSLPLHALASGKALLAALPDDELDRYFAESVRLRYTPSTITLERQLRRQIDDVRSSGIAITDEEYSLGIMGIAHGVIMAGQHVGSVSVAIPKVRCDEAMQRRTIDLLTRSCEQFENN